VVYAAKRRLARAWKTPCRALWPLKQSVPDGILNSLNSKTIGGHKMESKYPRDPDEERKQESGDADLAQQQDQESEEELDDLQKRVRAYPEAKWNLIQRVCGALIGVLCGSLLTYFSAMESIGMYGTIGALLIALFVPRLAEKRLKRSVNKGRTAMLSALALWIAVYAIVMIIKGVPFLTEG